MRFTALVGLAGLAVAATTAAAQQKAMGGGLILPTLPLTHTPTPPPLPISRFKAQPFHRSPLSRGVVFVPSYLYGVDPYNPYAETYAPPNVGVTNVSIAPEYIYLQQPEVQLVGPQYTGLQFWNPQVDVNESSIRSDATNTTAPLPPPAQPADVASLDAIINAYYTIVSGPSIKARDWTRFRSLFADGARLIATLSAPGLPSSPMVMTADQYANNAGPLLQRGFFEKEVYRAPVEQFGRIAQVFSTYESRFKDTDPVPFQRGVNSMQLMNDGNRWWIISVYWDAERPDNPIPAKFLPPKK